MNAKELEQFFQPIRLQIVRLSYRYLGASHYGYLLVTRNVVTQVITSYWNPTGRLSEKSGTWQHPEREDKPCPPEDNRAWLDAKDYAVQLAQREAELLKLPFNSNKDILEYKDLKDGPVQACVGCGKETKRAFVPLLCGECRAALKTGKAQLAERKLCLIETHDLLAYQHGASIRDIGVPIIQRLLNLAGTSEGPSADIYSHPDAVVIARGNGSLGRNWRYVSYLTLEQIEAFNDIRAGIDQIVAEVYRAGRERGESLLFGLARGEHTAEEFNDLTVRQS